MEARDFVCASYKLAGVVDVDGVVDKLSEHGHVAAVGQSGLRFLPDRLEWPATYFNFDGTIDLVTTGACLDELDEYIGVISDLLGVQISDGEQFDA
jgi:hypothetical protein